MQPGAHIDFETASATDLRLSGVHKYAECETTRAWGFSWSMGDGLIYQWRPGDPKPTPLLDWIAKGGRVVAHGAQFERIIWRMMKAKYGLSDWPDIQIEQQDCTLARAAAVALPQDLDRLGEVLGLTQKKDYEGSLLMKKMAKPRKRHADGTLEWWDEPKLIDRLMLYCDQDIRTEIEADEKLPPLSEAEREIWILDQKINDRGVYVDAVSVLRAVDLVEKAQKRLDAEMRTLTGGAVGKCTELDKLVAWIGAQGLPVDSLKKGDHEDVMALADMSDIPQIRRAIMLRRERSKTSTAKYSKILECICADGNIRGQFQYHGAAPGRWAGRLVQLQNLPRVDPDVDMWTVEYTIWVLSTVSEPLDGLLDLIECGAPEGPLPALSKSLRAMIKAAPGKKLIGGDFANIEGRINAWLAGEHWKLEAFEAYDMGYGPDLYKVGAAKLTGKRIEEVSKSERQVLGKVPELACGYQGGVGAFMTMAYTQNPPVQATELAKTVLATTPAETWDAMAAKYEGARDKHGLPERTWTAIKLIVTGWRTQHPAITQSWWDLQDAAIAAVETPGAPVHVYGGRVAYLCQDGWLYCRLPSGRVMHYCQPNIRYTQEEMIKVDGVWRDVNDYLFDPTEVDLLIMQGRTDGKVWKRAQNKVCFWALDGETKQWREHYLYGGLQCENIVQGAAACLLRHAMVKSEAAGYWLILHAHDEILAEVEKEFGSAYALKAIMEDKPAWLTGFPLAVAAWEDQRYVK